MMMAPAVTVAVRVMTPAAMMAPAVMPVMAMPAPVATGHVRIRAAIAVFDNIVRLANDRCRKRRTLVHHEHRRHTAMMVHMAIRHVTARAARMAVHDRRRRNARPVPHSRNRCSSRQTQKRPERRLAAATIAAAARRRTGRPDIVVTLLVTNRRTVLRLYRLRRCRGASITAGGSNGGYSVTGALKLDSIDHSRWKLVDRDRTRFGSISWRPNRGARPVAGK